LAVISAASLQTASAAAALSPKAWSVGATLRGFYDDNYASLDHSKGSGGFEVSPSVSFNLPLRQTDVGMRYTYGLYYYQDRQDVGVNPIDQTHQFEVWMDHKFNTRWHLNARDTFSIGQEPELLQTSASTPFRISGDNIANHATVSLETQWTHNFNTSAHYGNTWLEYQNSGAVRTDNLTPSLAEVLGVVNSGAFAYPTSTPGINGFSAVLPSLAGRLNRLEQNFGLDLQWVLTASSKVSVGYNFSLVNYTGNEDIAAFNYVDTGGAPRSLVYRSDSRDTLSHYGYLGFEHTFTANISGSIRAGANYTDNYNNPLASDPSFSPYLDLNVNYTFVPGSYVQLGATHDINSTDVTTPNAKSGKITSYQESTVVFADVNHKFNSNLSGTIIGRFQNSTYQGGASNDSSDQSYGVGVNLHYQINRHFSTEVGYNYDELISGLGGRNFARNRYYIGLTATY
jgi:hypothetical protein